ncbi:hypothetical protein [Thalassotalea atypica]|uniref:hypothetical protein n=1 Tax=Thalassotalea atypica TaxID=2054316 RepID=UPI002572DACE|nr:hypothetical protein [Thalassotalea atypica]
MKITMLLTITALLTFSYDSMAEYKKVYSEQGYPYKLLIHNADSVKIFYRESEQGISCRVKVSWDNKVAESKVQKISQQNFIKTPLASCLPRKQAKVLLAKTFSKNKASVFSQTKGL